MSLVRCLHAAGDARALMGHKENSSAVADAKKPARSRAGICPGSRSVEHVVQNVGHDQPREGHQYEIPANDIPLVSVVVRQAAQE